MTPDDPSWIRARRRRLRATLAGLTVAVTALGATVGAIAVPRLTWLVPPGWRPTTYTLLILGVIAPGTLLAGGAALVFGLQVGWPRWRPARWLVIGGVLGVFAGLYILDRVGLDPALQSYIVIGVVVGMTFIVAPALLAMLVRGVIVDPPAQDGASDSEESPTAHDGLR